MSRKSLILSLVCIFGVAGLLPLAAAQDKGPETVPFPASGGAEVVILDWHSFLGSGKSGIDFSFEELAAQLDRLAAMGYRFVSLTDALEGRIEGRANIVVTADDGNHSIYEAWNKVMKPRGIIPAFFCYPAVILGRISYAISAERLVELAQEGCVIGAHGYHHDPLSDKAWTKDRTDFRTEIRKPGPALAKILGSAPSLFAYPFGVYSARAEAELQKAGYAWAFAADAALHPVSLSDPGLDHLAVPRTIVYRWNVADLFKALEKRLKD